MSQFHTIDAIHQVLIVDGGDLPAGLPPALTANADWAKRLYPDAEYRLWSGDAIRGFLGEHFEPGVLDAFDTLRPYSYKCDLARFCLLHKLGGMYLDLGLRPMNHWNIPKLNGIAAFRDVAFISRSWSAIQTGLLWAEPGRPEFRLAIDFIVANCRRRFYGENPLYPTGPVLLGRAFVAAMVSKGQSPAADDQRIGQCRMITPDATMRNVSYVSWEGTLIALRTKIVDGDLGHLGLAGVNDYNAIWRARQVYGEVERMWAGNDPAIRAISPAIKTSTGVAVPLGMVGRVVFGPYLDLDAGQHSLAVAFGPDIRFTKLALEVSAANGSIVLHNADIGAPGTPAWLQTDFQTAQHHAGVEFRVSVFGDFVGEIRRLSLLTRTERTWTFEDTAIGIIGAARLASGIAIPPGTRGRVLYGPYTAMTAGSYTLALQFSPGTVYSRLLVEICGRAGNAVMHAHTVERTDPDGAADVSFAFELDEPLADAEFRVVVYGDFAGEFRRYTLVQTGERVSEPESAMAAPHAQPVGPATAAARRMSRLKEVLCRL